MSKKYTIFLFFALLVNANFMVGMKRLEKQKFLPKIEMSEVPEIEPLVDLKMYDYVISKALKINKSYREEIKQQNDHVRTLCKKLADSYSRFPKCEGVNFDLYEDLKEQESYLEYEENLNTQEEKKVYFDQLKLENSDLYGVLERLKNQCKLLNLNLENNNRVLRARELMSIKKQDRVTEGAALKDGENVFGDNEPSNITVRLDVEDPAELFDVDDPVVIEHNGQEEFDLAEKLRGAARDCMCGFLFTALGFVLGLNMNS